MAKEFFEHRTTADGWTAGKYRKEGDTVTMTEAEAKYETAIELIGPVKASDEAAEKTSENPASKTRSKASETK